MTEQTMVVSQPTEAQIGNPTPSAPLSVPDFSGKAEDFQNDLRKIAEATGMTIVNGNAVPKSEVQVQEQVVPAPAPVQPDRPQATVQPEVKVPDKFLTKDGQIDTEKVVKSTLHATEALKRYAEKEAELRKKQNEVTRLEQAPQAPFQGQPQPQAQGLTADRINEALANTKNPGQVMLELSQMAYASALQDAEAKANAKYAALAERMESQQRAKELDGFIEKDPWLMTPEGIDRLATVRAENPWINSAPNSWHVAYQYYKGQEALQRPNSQVQIPNPTASTVRAPATPVEAAARLSQAQSLNLTQLANNPALLNKYLDSLPDDKSRKEFWQSTGLGFK